jgi:hypothetical protein
LINLGIIGVTESCKIPLLAEYICNFEVYFLLETLRRCITLSLLAPTALVADLRSSM